MESKFTIGDTVQLKSGGPFMTVSEIYSYDGFNSEKLPFSGTIYTSWFDKVNLKGGSFHQDMLDKVEP